MSLGGFTPGDAKLHLVSQGNVMLDAEAFKLWLEAILATHIAHGPELSPQWAR